MKTILTFLLLAGIVLSLKSSLRVDNKLSLTVTYEVENPTNQTIKMLKWGTPLDYQKDVFIIKGPGGKQATYIEKVFKRGAPLEQDYITLSPRSSYSEKINLADYYSFPVRGMYSVTLDEQVLQDGSAVISFEKENIVFIYVKEPTVENKFDLVKSKAASSSSQTQADYINCSSEDRKVVEQNLVIGKRESICARNCLSANSCGTNYVLWFGVMDSTRYRKVASDFVKIAAAFDQPFKIYCRHKDCRSGGPTAYVYPSDTSRTIYLCPGFFTSGEKAETLVHEFTHFKTIAGTSDHIYGRKNCQSLARSSPEKAVSNADSQCYFANTC